MWKFLRTCYRNDTIFALLSFTILPNLYIFFVVIYDSVEILNVSYMINMIKLIQILVKDRTFFIRKVRTPFPFYLAYYKMIYFNENYVT